MRNSSNSTFREARAVPNFKHKVAAVLLLFAALPACGGSPSPSSDGAPTVTSERHAFRAVTLVQGLVEPWSLAFLPEGEMLVTERPGQF